MSREWCLRRLSGALGPPPAAHDMPPCDTWMQLLWAAAGRDPGELATVPHLACPPLSWAWLLLSASYCVSGGCTVPAGRRAAFSLEAQVIVGVPWACELAWRNALGNYHASKEKLSEASERAGAGRCAGGPAGAATRRHPDLGRRLPRVRHRPDAARHLPASGRSGGGGGHTRH